MGSLLHQRLWPHKSWVVNEKLASQSGQGEAEEDDSPHEEQGNVGRNGRFVEEGCQRDGNPGDVAGAARRDGERDQDVL